MKILPYILGIVLLIGFTIYTSLNFASQKELERRELIIEKLFHLYSFAYYETESINEEKRLNQVILDLTCSQLICDPYTKEIVQKLKKLKKDSHGRKKR